MVVFLPKRKGISMIMSMLKTYLVLIKIPRTLNNKRSTALLKNFALARWLSKVRRLHRWVQQLINTINSHKSHCLDQQTQHSVIYPKHSLCIQEDSSITAHHLTLSSTLILKVIGHPTMKMNSNQEPQWISNQWISNQFLLPWIWWDSTLAHLQTKQFQVREELLVLGKSRWDWPSVQWLDKHLSIATVEFQATSQSAIKSLWMKLLKCEIYFNKLSTSQQKKQKAFKAFIMTLVKSSLIL